MMYKYVTRWASYAQCREFVKRWARYEQPVNTYIETPTSSWRMYSEEDGTIEVWSYSTVVCVIGRDTIRWKLGFHDTTTTTKRVFRELCMLFHEWHWHGIKDGSVSFLKLNEGSFENDTALIVSETTY